MKKFLKIAFIALFVVSLVLAGCSKGAGGGSSPKALAKQYVELAVQGSKLTEAGVSDEDPKRKALIKKSEELDQKVNKLSDEDKTVFYEELGTLLEAAGL